MKTITKNCVAIQAPVQTKEEAIRLAGKMLLDAGYIAAPYIESGRRFPILSSVPGWRFRTG